MTQPVKTPESPSTQSQSVAGGEGSHEGQILDVLIIGAGLSGIGAAYRISERMPDAELAILEARPGLGGTWDLFRYPGIRSDSDMYTLAYPFEPWRGENAIASGADILQYLKDTADKHGISQKIRYNHKVVNADWRSSEGIWVVTAQTPEGIRTLRARFVYACSGYYSYAKPYVADIPGLQDFAGEVIHPQSWPEGLNVEGQRVIVIGSGATAISLVPALAKAGADVTMLQRTPTFVLAQSAEDPTRQLLHGRFSDATIHRLARAKNVGLQWGSYKFARKFPNLARKALNANVKFFAGAEHVPSFTAPYNPWDQRLCVVPQADLFRVLKDSHARIVTDRIATVKDSGISTESGAFLPADIIVTATGLSVELLGGAQVSMDGVPVKPEEHCIYRGCMLEGVPNFGLCVGYLNASWGLRSDLSNQFISKIIEKQRQSGLNVVVPTASHDLARRPLFEMESGYLKRAAALMPRRAETAPWTMRQDYLAERREMAKADLVEDLVFSRAQGDAQLREPAFSGQCHEESARGQRLEPQGSVR